MKAVYGFPPFNLAGLLWHHTCWGWAVIEDYLFYISFLFFCRATAWYESGSFYIWIKLLFLYFMHLQVCWFQCYHCVLKKKKKMDRGWFPSAVTCLICLFAPSDDLNDDEEKAEELALGSTGFRGESTAPVDNFYSGQQNFGVYADDDLESRDQGALPPATSTGSTTIDTPTLTVQCRKESFQIALRAGSVSGVKVKGMCRGVFVCISHPTPPSRIDAWQLAILLPTPDSKNANYILVTKLPKGCGYQVNDEQNTVTIPFTGCHVKARVNCNVSVYARYWNMAECLDCVSLSLKGCLMMITGKQLHSRAAVSWPAERFYCILWGDRSPNPSHQWPKCKMYSTKCSTACV